MKSTLGAMLAEVVRHLFRKPATEFYPFEKRVVPAGLRGKPVMDPNLCLGCRMCQRDCPSEAIEISPSETVTDAAGKPKKKFMMTLHIDRCTHCGQCEESCPVKPVKACRLDDHFEHAAFDRDSLTIIYR